MCVELPDFALRNIDLSIDDGDYFMLVGPTGSGKTVLLETIAGLHSHRKGEIWFGDRAVERLEPERRGVGIVYQDCALFPHLSVADNVVFGLRIRNVGSSAMKSALEKMASLVGIGHLLNRLAPFRFGKGWPALTSQPFRYTVRPTTLKRGRATCLGVRRQWPSRT